MMSEEAQGLGIEIAGLGQVAFFLGALIPGYWWVSKAGDPKAMLGRGALLGAGLLALAIGMGLRER